MSRRFCAKQLIHLEWALARKLTWLVNTKQPQILRAGLTDVREVGQRYNAVSIYFARIHGG